MYYTYTTLWVVRDKNEVSGHTCSSQSWIFGSRFQTIGPCSIPQINPSKPKGAHGAKLTLADFGDREGKDAQQMESFLNSLTQSLQDSVVASIRAKLESFADAVVSATEGKVSKEQVLECWNKLHPDVPAAASVSPTSSKPRAQTDKERKCPVIKKSGKFAGEPCGKNCLVGKDCCSAHDPEKKTASSVAASSVAAPSVAAPSVPASSAAPSVAPSGEEVKIPPAAIPGDEVLKSMTVVKLVELAKSLNLKIAARPKKDDAIKILSQARG